MEWGGPRSEARGLRRLICKIEITATRGQLPSTVVLRWGCGEASGAAPVQGLASRCKHRKPKGPGGAVQSGVTLLGVSSLASLFLPGSEDEMTYLPRVQLGPTPGRGPRKCWKATKSAGRAGAEIEATQAFIALLTPGGAADSITDHTGAQALLPARAAHAALQTSQQPPRSRPD